MAEGFYRGTASDKSHFYYDSLASNAEVQNQLMVARDVGYLTNEVYAVGVLTEIQRMLFGLIKTSCTKPLS